MVCCWKATEFWSRLQISWISVASSLELCQPFPSFVPFWTYDVLVVAPCLSKVPISYTLPGLSNWWQRWFSQLCFNVFIFIVQFLCLSMVSGCKVSPIQPMTSPLHNLLAWIALNLYLTIFLVLGLTTFLLQYAFLCHGSVCVQVLPSNSLGLAALSFASSCSSCLLLPSWVQRQDVYTDCSRQWMSFFLCFFLYICLRQCITFLFTFVLYVQNCILYILVRIWHVIKSFTVAKQSLSWQPPSSLGRSRFLCSLLGVTFHRVFLC